MTGTDKIQNDGSEKIGLPRLIACISIIFLLSAVTACDAEAGDPLKVLMITGGGWHDYDAQKHILENGISERVNNISFTIDHQAGDVSDGFIDRHEDTQWAQEFDLVLYNMCFADNRDKEWSQRIVNAHVEHNVPAVVLHCAMHSYNYHDDDDTWRRFIGMRTPNHQSHMPFTVEVLESDHPILHDFPGIWDTPRGELYNVEGMYDSATPLAHAYGEDTGEYHVTIWVNNYEGVRVFGTTIGHHNETMEHENYLNLVANGLLWAADKLD